MARRMVVLGWDGDALEVSPLDADLLVKDKICRVSFRIDTGDLADALILVPHRKALGVAFENSKRADHDKVMARVRLLCTSAREVTVGF